MNLSIQYLRAVAALMVVVFHFSSKLQMSQGQEKYFEIGAAGVDIFFAISGFVMCYTTIDRKIGPVVFYQKRVFRILPLYWFVTSLVILLVAIVPAVASNTKLTWDHILASYAFVAYPHPAFPARLWPVVVPGWTLNYEMFFYLLLGVALLAREAWRLGILSALILGLVALGLVFDPGEIGRFYVSPLLLEFLAGFWLAQAYCRGFQLPAVASLVLIGASLVWLFTIGAVIDPTDWHRTVAWGIPCFGLVAGIILLNRARPFRDVSILRLLGDASYSIYLSQFLAVSAFAIVWRKLGLSTDAAASQAAFIATGGIAVVIFGILLHFAVEVPLTRMLYALIPNTKKSALVAGAER